MAEELNQNQTTEEEKAPLIWVTAVGEPDGQVILWERDPRHPAPEGKPGITKRENEIFVVRDGQGYQVAETPRVKQLIGEGVLAKVNWNSKVNPNKTKKNGGNGPSNPLQPATNRPNELPDDEPTTPLTPASTTFGKSQVKK